MVGQAKDIAASDKLKQLLHAFSDVTSIDEDDLGKIATQSQHRRCSTHPSNAEKVTISPERYSAKHVEGDQGVIEQSSGSWPSPIVLAKTKDGTCRFCVDFRRVNDVTKKDVHPLPRIHVDKTLDVLEVTVVHNNGPY